VLDTIQWHEGGVFHLERSKATIRVPNRFAVALDSYGLRLMEPGGIPGVRERR